MFRSFATGFCVLAVFAIASCVTGSAGAGALEDLQERLKLLEAEKKVAEARAALEEARIKEEFAREKALKEIFGAATGKEGTIAIGEAKPFLRIQPAGADAVKGLAAQMCDRRMPGLDGAKPYVVTEAQFKLEVEASAFMETLKILKTELEARLRIAKLETKPETVQVMAVEALVLLPVFANAIASVLKLFRSDLGVGLSDNPSFAVLFADVLMTSPQCRKSLSFPSQKRLREGAATKAKELQEERGRLLSLVADAEAFLKPHEKSTDSRIGAVRVAMTALKDAANVLAPGVKESRLSEFATALALSEQLGDAIRLSYRLDTQQAQVFKTGFFTGTQLKRTASAQVFYRTFSKDGDLLGSGYVAYSSRLGDVALLDEECYRLDQSGEVTTSCQ